MHASHQLTGAERLGHVVVCAELQPRDPVRFLRACGQQNDGDVKPRRPQLSADGEPVFAWQHDIEHDEIEVSASCRADTGLAIADDFNVESFNCQVVMQPERYCRLVFDNKNAPHVVPASSIEKTL